MRKNMGVFFIILALTILTNPAIVYGISVDPSKILYPPARIDNTVDDYHGVKVPDPYRWLEDPNSEETITWVEEENQLTNSFLTSYPGREKIKKELTELWNHPKYSIPIKRGERYFFSKNDGLQNQSVLYMQKGLTGKPIVILNPNEFSKDGTVALSSKSYSRDGTLLAYGLSTSGSDWQEIKIRDIDKEKDYDEIIKWSRGGGVSWKKDNSGFYYSRYPEPGTVAKEDETKYKKVYWHKLNTPQSEDKLIYEMPEDKELSFYPFITDDGTYLILSGHKGTDVNNRIYYRKIDSDGPFVKLLDKNDASYNFIDNTGDLFYFNTDLNAPKGRIIAIDLNHPEPEAWKEIIPEQEDPISAIMVNNKFILTSIHDACYKMKIYNLDGSFNRKIGLPVPGSIGAITGEREDKEMFFSFTSFLYPTNIFRYDFKSEKLEVFHKSEVKFDPDSYETKQIFYNSKDGTRIPMFLTYKKGLKLDGSNPAILYGYGGFSNGLTPFFSTSNIIWLEKGGIYAVANIRGGDEYGEEWHRAGMFGKKQNVFDDFIWAAQWLIDNKYTCPSKLAINGASNGGLLVAACMVQRPDLFGAVVCEVPLTDMLRYHKFTVGHYWVVEYGSSDNPEEFKYLYSYSPLHNIKKGIAYPPTLVMTADHDDRVVASHAKKFVATLQAADKGENPILLRVETKAGHGGGKPTTKMIEEMTDVYSFLFKLFNM